MALVSVVPIAEAAAFTVGCVVLQTRRLDPARVERALVLIAAMLALALLILITPERAADAIGLYPDEIVSFSG